MNVVTYVAAVTGLVAVLLVVLIAVRRRRQPRKLDAVKYQKKWNDVQAMLHDSKLWALAIIDADKLLDEALKEARFKGKCMGERLVAAQRELMHNDKVWFAHKLRNKLVHEQEVKLRKNDVKEALIGVRAALKDIGALQ